jgi:hypothetical protein
MIWFLFALLALATSAWANCPCPTSINGSTIPSFSQLVDSSGNAWTVDGSGKCYENGTNVGGCSAVSLLLWYNGNIYASTTAPDWYEWTGTGWNSLGNVDPRVTSLPIGYLGTTTPNRLYKQCLGCRF